MSSPASNGSADCGRRELAVAVLLCAAGAGLALYAGSRTWLVETVTRPAPLGPASTPRAGTDLVPALAAVSLVVLAGAGALLATRGRSRRLVGALILVGGLAAAGLALSALGRDRDRRGLGRCDRHRGCGRGGCGRVRADPGGGVASARGTVRTAHTGRRPARRGLTVPADLTRWRGGSAETGDAISQEFWDALDRGDDPTKS